MLTWLIKRLLVPGAQYNRARMPSLNRPDESMA